MRHMMIDVLTCLLPAVLLAGCGGGSGAGSSTDDSPAASGLEVRSPAFEHEAAIPAKYTCDGEDISPGLAWTAGPAGTVGYALIMDDPDAPGQTWVHWVAYNLTVTELAECVSSRKEPARDFAEGLNSWITTGYGGPCPPSGTHRYFFKVYALDVELSFATTPTKANLLKAMEGHILAEGELMGTYACQQ